LALPLMPSRCSVLSTSTRSSPGDRLPRSRPLAFSADTRPSTSERTLPASVRHHRFPGRNATFSLDLDDSLTCILAIVHAIVFLLVVGYAQQYYFHLRKSKRCLINVSILIVSRPPQEQCSLDQWLDREQEIASARSWLKRVHKVSSNRVKRSLSTIGESVSFVALLQVQVRHGRVLDELAYGGDDPQQLICDASPYAKRFPMGFWIS
jgi:hypothetical protein